MIIFDELFKNIEIVTVVGEKDGVIIKGIETNSKEISNDYAFLCIKGYTVDGHKYIASAIDKGAKVIICEEIPLETVEGIIYVQLKDTKKSEPLLAINFYKNPSKELNIFGVTGTNGKTTTAKIVHELTKIMGNKSGYAGTVGIEYDDVLEESKNTTGNPLTVQKMLRRMADEGIKDVAIEVSSHALVLERILGTDINIAGFTNLTQDHLDFHETIEEYEKAKATLFTEYVNDVEKYSVINVDDVVGKKYSNLGDSFKITYSLNEEYATLYAFDVELGAVETDFKMKYDGKVYKIKTNLVGKFNVYNALCAIGTLLARGCDIDEIVWALASFKTVSGRMELVENRLKRAVYVDYAHTPDGLENVLKSVNEFKKGNSIVIFGCGGDRDKTKRPIMASIAERLADKVYLTNDNPRTENPKSIIEDVVKGFSVPENVEVVLDRKEAIQKAIKSMGEKDVLIIAGKGHEDYQIIGTEKVHFSDVEVVKSI